MRLVLGSNIASLQAQRKLGDSSAALTTVFERLSTGQRINRASDDAAGLAVLAKLSTYSKILKRAALNVSDANSLLSIADGALEQVSGMLTRMQELAAQAANGSFNRTQRASLDKEFASLDAEIKRITSSTQFNGINLFEGEKVAPTGELIHLATDFNQGTSMSANGRFSVTNQGGGSSIWYDSVTGETRTISTSDFPSYFVLDNGDFIYQTSGSFQSGQIWSYSASSGQSSRITNEATADSMGRFSVSADGSTLAFTSSTNYSDGEGVESASGSGVLRLYVMDLNTGIVRTNNEQVSNGQVRVSSDGSQVALVSNRIGGSLFGRNEVVSASFNGSGVSNFNRLTDAAVTAGEWFNLLGVDNLGNAIVETKRNLSGDNPSPFRQFFRVEANGSVNQLTSFTQDNPIGAQVDPRSSAIYFLAGQDLVGENPLLVRQLFSLDLSSGELSQITNMTSNALLGASAISGDGRFITVQSNFSVFRFDVSPGKKNYNFEVGQGSKGGISAELESIRSSMSGLGTLVISSQQSAGFALDAIGDNLAALSSLRGRIGASQSRLSTAASLVNSQQTEFEAAASRIKDVDVAFESANLVRLSIQQQAAASVLSQANQQPTLALDLLRDI